MASQDGYESVEGMTNFVETSDVLIEYYKNQKLEGHTDFIPQIEEFLKRKPARDIDNHPLIFDAGDEIVNKTLICTWMEHHKSQRTPQVDPSSLLRTTPM
jgi:hypothetical protein